MKVKIWSIILLVISISILMSFPAFGSDLSISQTFAVVETDPNHPVINLSDDNSDTYWSLQPGNTNGWAQLNLDKPAFINGLKIFGWLGNDTRLVIEYQWNGKWIPFAGGVYKTVPANGIIDLSYDRIVTSNLRLRLKGSDASSSRISEVKVIGQTADSLFHALRPKNIIADNSSSPNAPVTFLCDKNTYTQWQTKDNSTRGEVVFEFPVVSSIRNINIYFTDAAKGNFKLEALKTDASWQQIATFPTQSVGWYRLDLNIQNISTYKIRLTVTGSSGILGRISEIEFWGYGAFPGDSRQLIGDGQPVTIQANDASGNPTVDGKLNILTNIANMNTITTSIEPNVKLYNTSTQVVNLKDVKLRYWYSNETQKPQVAHIYWSNIGGQKITTVFKTVNNNVDTDTYLELGFISSAGTLAPGEYVEIQFGFNSNDWSDYNQQNDYSFKAGNIYAINPKMTGYIDGSLSFGAEPGNRPPSITQALNLQFMNSLVDSMSIPNADGRVKVLYQCAISNTTTNSIQFNVKVKNTWFNPINLADLKLRYWYTNETKKSQTANIYWSNIGAQKVTNRFVSVENNTGNADTYLELGFTDGTLAPGAEVEIHLGFNTKDWANYNQSNDYSFSNFSIDYSENPKLTGYINGQLSWGIEPGLQPYPSFGKNYRLELVFAGIINEPAYIDLNGMEITLKPALYIGDHTVFTCQLSNDQFWQGANFLRIKPFLHNVTLEQTFISYHINTGEQSIIAGSLNDGLFLTAADTSSGEFKFNQKVLIEEATVSILDANSNVRLFAWVNGSWLELTPNGQSSMETIFAGLVTTDKLKLEMFGTLGELQIRGSAVTDQAPTVQIFWPQNGEEITQNGWANQELRGFVDNPESSVDINGNSASLTGHYFTIRLNKTGIKPGDTMTLTATATDLAGRKGSDAVTVSLGKFADASLDQPDVLVYTDQSTFTISGYVSQPNKYRVSVNDNPVTVSGNRFVTSVMLKEGLNVIKVQFINNKDLAKTFYRRVVRYSGAFKLTVTAPENGTYINTASIEVSGFVTGLNPIQVTVNGTPAFVSGSSFRATVSLTNGSNTISVIASDVKGNKEEQKFTVYRDLIPPVIENVIPEKGKTFRVSAINVSAKITDQNPVSVSINGQPVIGNQGIYQTTLNLPDGNQTIAIIAQDAAGNTSTHTINLLIDTVAPEAFTPVTNPSGWSNNNKPTITFNSTDGGSGIDHYEIRLDDGVWSNPVTSPYQFTTAIPDGEHSVYVKAVDKVGNETVGEGKVSIDTMLPQTPKNLRVIPGNGRMILKWEEDSTDVVQYRIERNPAGDSGPYTTTGLEFIDDKLQNGDIYNYRIFAVDRAGNQSASTEWKEGKVGLAEATYVPNEGAVIEYDHVALAIPKTGVSPDVAGIQVTEVQSEHLTSKSYNLPMSPIYEFTAVKANGTPFESIKFTDGYLGKIEFDPSIVPPGFPKQNLAVFYYNPDFGQWYRVPICGVDVEHNTIFFITNHFSSFQVQASIVQDLSPQEYKDVGYSPLKSYSVHEGVAVSPQGGSVSTSTTELAIPGRNGFDLILKRYYNSNIARVDSLALNITWKISFNIIKPDGNLMKLKEIQDAINGSSQFNWNLPEQIEHLISNYLANQGDYAYSMGQGWRLNIPYIRQNLSSPMLCTPDGTMYNIESDMQRVNDPLKIPNTRVDNFDFLGKKINIPDFRQYIGFLLEDVNSPYRLLSVKQNKGDNFSLQLFQFRKSYVNYLFGGIIAENKYDWVTICSILTLKDGTTYILDCLGRTIKMIDPTGLNSMTYNYNGLCLDNITDSMGRVTKFSYNMTLFWPRITKIWVENDPYHRQVTYSVGIDAKLNGAQDAAGRQINYSYDTRLLFGGSVSVRINFFSMLIKIIGGPVAQVLGPIFGVNDFDVCASLQVQLISSLNGVGAPGIGYTAIGYETKSYTFTTCTVEYDGIINAIPVALVISVFYQQRLCGNDVWVYDSSGGHLLRHTHLAYDMDNKDNQAYFSRAIENNGKTITTYHYTWSGYADPVNTAVEVNEAGTNKQIERSTMSYDTSTLMLKEKTTYHGDNYRKITCNYDDWGNLIYNEDYSVTGDRINSFKTWMYYLNTNSAPASDALWLGSPFNDQPALARDRHDLMIGKIVADYIPNLNGESKVNYLNTYNRFSSLGQLTGSAQWNGNEWLKTRYEYDTPYGSLTKKINSEGHETVYEYDNNGFSSAVTEKSVKDAAGITSDIVTRMGYEYISGWKKWQKNPRGYVTEFEYDLLGRTIKITAPDDDDQTSWVPDGSQQSFRLNNPVTQIQYNDQTFDSTVIAPMGKKTFYDFDTLGQLVKLIKYQRDQNGNYQEYAMTTLGYDGWGNITSITDPNGNGTGPAYRYTTRYEYDALNRNSAIIYPDDTESPDDNPRKTMLYDYGLDKLTITDERNNQTVQLMDMQGRMIDQIQAVDDKTIESKHYYDGLGNEVITIDPKGSKTVKTYNPLNLPSRIDLPEEKFWENGREVTITPYRRYEYNAVGVRIAEIMDSADGERTSRFEPDELSRIIRTKSTYTDNGTLKNAVSEVYYDGNGNKVKVVDANNTLLPKDQQKSFTYSYSASDLILSEIDPAGNKTTYTYDLSGNLTSMTDPRGNSGKYSGDFTIVYHYDDLNRLIKGELPASPGQTVKPVVSLAYDPRGNLLERIEPDILKTTYTYWPRNLIKTVTTQGSGVTYTITHYFDEAGNETRIVDPRNNPTNKEYDSLNRLVKIEYPQPSIDFSNYGITERFEYDENNNRTAYLSGRFVDGHYVTTNYSYNRYNKLVQVTDPDNHSTIYRYDRLGNLVETLDPLSHSTKYDYDELNRLILQTNPDRTKNDYRYDALGNRSWSRDPNGTETKYIYYSNNLVQQIDLKNGDRTEKLEYTYDEAGYRKSARNSQVLTEYNISADSYVPDPFGRIYRENKTFDNRNFTVQYGYDVTGRMTGITYPTGQTVEYQYNNLGQLLKVPGYIKSTLYPLEYGGLITNITAENGVQTILDYDKNGRLKYIGAADKDDNKIKGYNLVYDDANNIIQKNMDTFKYDRANQLIQADLKGVFEGTSKDDRLPTGRKTLDYCGLHPLDFAIDQMELIELDYAAGSVGVDLQVPVFISRIELKPNNPVHNVAARNIRVYISKDNITYSKVSDWTLNSLENGSAEIQFANPLETRFIKVKSMIDDRDSKFKLVNKAQFINTPQDIINVYYFVKSRIEDYSYYEDGNRKAENITERVAISQSYAYYPGTDRLKSNEKYDFEYDANGNLTKKTSKIGPAIVWTYEYDLLNRLIKVSKNDVVVAEYLYDESGLRLKKTGPAGSIYYTFDLNGNVIYEQENKDYREYVYVLGKHFARVDGNLDNSITKKYFYQTDHLGSTVLVTDETGKQVWNAEYTPFGKLVGIDGELDHVTQFTGKDLDEDTGLYYFNARWYDQEVGRFISEDPGDDPLIYAYCSNNPLTNIDPTGFGPENYTNEDWINYCKNREEDNNGGKVKQPGLYRDLPRVYSFWQEQSFFASTHGNPWYQDPEKQLYALGMIELEIKLTGADGYIRTTDMLKDAHKIEAIQSALKMKVDGNYDRKMADALETIQTKFGIKGDGNTVGPDTIKALTKLAQAHLEYDKKHLTYAKIMDFMEKYGVGEGFYELAIFSEFALVNISGSKNYSREAIEDDTQNNQKIHKNSNTYVGPQAVYEIRINGKIYKYGKADMTDIASTGFPRRLQSQINKLMVKYPNATITGRVLYQDPNISTADIKKVETNYVQKYYDQYGVEPPGNQNHPGLKK